MRTFKTWLITVAALLCGITASAESVEINGIWYNLITKAKQAEVIDNQDPYTSYSGNIIIPSRVIYNNVEYQVTSIGESAFGGCGGITSIIIPEGITSIGESAFTSCTLLNSITIPNSVTDVGYSVFMGCKELSSVNLGSGITSIKYDMFKECCNLTSITLPESVTNIEGFAFYGCGNLVSITIPENVTLIGERAFDECRSLTCIVLPKKIEEIRNMAFTNCGALLDVYCHAEQIPIIEADAFDGSYPEYITLHVPASSLEAYKAADVWKDFGNIVAIAEAPTIVASGTCGDNLTWELTDAGELVIEGTGAMTGFSFTGTVTAAPWGEFAADIATVSIGDGVTTVGERAFYGCNNLTSAIMPNSLNSIRERAFYGCCSLVSITIPESVTSIGTCAFYNCSNLTSITISKGVTEIAANAFSCCSNLTSITIDANNTVYDSRDNCNAIIETSTNTLIVGSASTVIPNTVTSITSFAFVDCSNLASIIIPEGIPVIDHSVFKGCSSLLNVYLPSSIVAIGPGAFNSCRSLKTITCNAAEPPFIFDNASSDEYVVFYEVPLEECVLYVPDESVESYKSANIWSEFGAILPMSESVKILDGEDFVCEEDKECANITYTRTFNNTNWQALYVPFEIPVTEEFLADFEVAYINDARQYDHDEDGKKDETIIEAFKIKTGTLEANYPYLIRAKEVGEKAITVTDATLYAAEENYIDCSSVFETYTFTGTYTRMSSDELSGYYSLSGGIWRPIAEGASLGAFRIYLKVDSRNGNTAPARAIRMRVIGDDTDDDATSIDVMESTDDRLQTTVIYDLHGRRIENTENLKGVYVVNGRKVVF